MEFPSTTRFFSSDVATYPSLLREPHKHKEAAWRKIPRILKGLETLPAYQSVVWTALVSIAIVRPIQQVSHAIDDLHAPIAGRSIKPITIQAKRISRLSHSLRNTNEWCAQATKNWTAAQMQFQILGQRLTRVENKIFDASPSQPEHVSQPKHTVVDLCTAPPLDNIFVSPVTVTPDNTGKDVGGESPQVILVSHKSETPY